MLLVGGLERRPAIRQSMVPYNGAKIRFQVRDHLPHRLQESVDRIGGLAPRIGQPANGEKGSVKIVMTIDEKQSHELKGTGVRRQDASAFPTIAT